MPPPDAAPGIARLTISDVVLCSDCEEKMPIRFNISYLAPTTLPPSCQRCGKASPVPEEMKPMLALSKSIQNTVLPTRFRAGVYMDVQRLNNWIASNKIRSWDEAWVRADLNVVKYILANHRLVDHRVCAVILDGILNFLSTRDPRDDVQQLLSGSSPYGGRTRWQIDQWKYPYNYRRWLKYLMGRHTARTRLLAILLHYPMALTANPRDAMERQGLLGGGSLVMLRIVKQIRPTPPIRARFRV
jgi:hypothetical protein